MDKSRLIFLVYENIILKIILFILNYVEKYNVSIEKINYEKYRICEVLVNFSKTFFDFMDQKSTDEVNTIFIKLMDSEHDAEITDLVNSLYFLIKYYKLDKEIMYNFGVDNIQRELPTVINFNESEDTGAIDLRYSEEDNILENKQDKAVKELVSKINFINIEENIKQDVKQDVLEEFNRQEEVTLEDVKQDVLEESNRQEVTLENVSKQDVLEEFNRQEVTLEDVSKQDVILEDIFKQEVTLEDVSKQEVTLEDISKQEVTLEDISKQEVTLEDVSKQEVTLEDVSKQEVTLEDVSEQDVIKEDLERVNRQEVTLEEGKRKLDEDEQMVKKRKLSDETKKKKQKKSFQHRIGIIAFKFSRNPFFGVQEFTIATFHKAVTREHCDESFIKKIKQHVKDLKITHLYVQGRLQCMYLRKHLNIYVLKFPERHRVLCFKCGRSSCSIAKVKFFYDKYYNYYLPILCDAKH